MNAAGIPRLVLPLLFTTRDTRSMTVEAARTPISAIPLELRPGEYLRLAREISAAPRPELEHLRIAILASSTLDFLRPVLIVEAARSGFGFDPFLGAFGQLEQPVLDDASELYSSERDALVLVFQPTDLMPDVIDRYYRTNGRELGTLCADLTNRLIRAARTFREKTGQPVLVANFAMPALPPLGPFDAGDPNGLTHRLAAHNAALAERVHGEAGVYLWDYAGLVHAAGSADWSDARLTLLARVTVGSHQQAVMARHLLRTLSALRRTPAKCLVLDLDNTLWGGVVGDDGLGGLVLGDDWPGNAYKLFQRAVLGLRDRGVLLALASKNDESVASRVFRTHPEMLISWDDLAAIRINWEPKSVNMRSIAEELNIGTDALVLFDDNPVERAEVRAALPEARIIEVPSDPARYRETLLSSGYFDQPSLSTEDRRRAAMYSVERERHAALQEAPSMESFLQSLEMTADVSTAGSDTLARIGQLVGKTNQFNLTTRRHSLAEIAKMAADPRFVVAWLRLRDRFGEHGLVAVGILEQREGSAYLDTFLMSCRVMNRGVERAMMAYLVEMASVLGCSRLVGEYRPTAKNHIVAELLTELGFSSYGDSDGGTLWILNLDDAPNIWPAHIERGRATNES